MPFIIALVAAESSGTQDYEISTYASKCLLNAGAFPVGPVVGVIVVSEQYGFVAAVLLVFISQAI